MLVIKRKKNEGLQIGDDITVKIVEINENSVKIAIDAPRETLILRTELLEEVKDENYKAIIGDLNSLDALKNVKK
ncbi:carbon storage regulator CsrA [Oceanirhabdus sp. W0125-5]|uniref:carbon storage regulator CsrA n=1 Tax=Oceanirhabdus sp. W0125-5 TaxID=2999116 RepID=UPI0022F30D74|nr:carbon storage regulator CsrA [Oceanirhabdus sp. W0125-5]WBW95469.1 carbon storage regulator CsrA [Oceanirhabdus sp. W0125-5]